MDRKKRGLLLAVVAGCLLLLIAVRVYLGAQDAVTDDEKNAALLELRGENEELFPGSIPAGTVAPTSVPAPSREPTRQVYVEEPLNLTPMEVIEQNKEGFDDIIRLLRYGVQPTKSKFEILDGLRPYVSDSFYQFYEEYFRHLDEDVEVPEYWPTQEGMYTYIYGDNGEVLGMLTVEAFVEQHGRYPNQQDIVIIEERNPQTISVDYKLSEEEERVVVAVVQDTVMGGEEHINIYFDAGGRVWYFY